MTFTAVPSPLLPRPTQVEVNGETVDAVEHINELVFDVTITESRHLNVKLPDHIPAGVQVLIRVEPNGRTEEEIDRQVQEEPDSWG